MPLSVGQREDRSGGGGPDAGQGGQRRDVAGHLAAVALADEARGTVQIAGPGVVAEAAPQVQDFVHLGRGERGHVREAAHEGGEVGEHRRDLGLLQHDLRHPYPVGCRLALPGQVVTAVARVPGEESGCEGLRAGAVATHTPPHGARCRGHDRRGSGRR